LPHGKEAVSLVVKGDREGEERERERGEGERDTQRERETEKQMLPCRDTQKRLICELYFQM
jgi:hypothetical protein